MHWQPDTVIGLRSDLAQPIHSRGRVLWLLGRHHAALDSYNVALSIVPQNQELLDQRGLALTALERHEQALENYDAALALQPSHIEALNNRGNALASLQRFDHALECYERVLAISPGRGDALNNKGAVLVALQKFGDALKVYEAALKHQPKNIKIRYNRGVALLHLQHHADALAEFEAVLASDPRYPYALSAAANAALNLCDWPRVNHYGELLKRAVSENTSVIAPFTLLGYSDDPALQLQCAMAWLVDKDIKGDGAWQEQARHAHAKLRVAYISSDFGAHPVGFQIASLLENHDRSAFEIHGVSIGSSDGSNVRARLISACDHFHDVCSMSNRDALTFLRQFEFDIAVDLNGHTQNARPNLFAARVAPVQVNWLGYPSTTGLTSMDYLIADANALPLAQQLHYSERIVHLPDSFFAPGNSFLDIGVASRLEEGLPEAGVVLCCFNQSWKIREELFDIWMTLLKKVPGSVLWLKDHPLNVRLRLEQEAHSRGVNKDRLIWARRSDRNCHLARLKLADIVLDTLPYNAHATASDALWAGVPIVTCLGATLAGRVASSLLYAAGLSELVTQTLADYENLALILARDPVARENLREKMTSNRALMPFFDCKRHVRMMEAAYRQMWRNNRNGAASKGFEITLQAIP